jgi:3-hydroxybutyryl-CoA dehydrogenase
MKQISVIGAGTMGNGIAHVFAQYGFQVSLIDVSASQLEKHGLLLIKISIVR